MPDATSKPRVWNKRDKNVPPDAVYVGRPTKWGNPFKLTDRNPSTGQPVTRDEVIAAYRAYVLRTGLDEHARIQLRGKDLVCWCAPLSCHADVLLELANGERSR